MAVTVQMQFESVVTQMYQDAFVGSSIENGTTIIIFDLRLLDFQQQAESKDTWDLKIRNIRITADFMSRTV